MRDSEFYTPEEHWPQPPDDSCTLEGKQQGRPAGKKQKKLSTAKVKKKMSESLAGVTAAAIAVVMVATAIPSLKDAFDDLPDLPELIQPDHGYSTCPICEIPYCPYFDASFDCISYGIRVELPDGSEEPVYYHAEDVYTMRGFITDDLLHRRYATIVTEKMERIVLVGSKTHSMDIGSEWHWFSHNKFMHDPVGYAYTGVMMEFQDEKSPNDSNFGMFNLVYDPAGTPQLITVETVCEESYIYTDTSDAEYYNVDIPGHPNIQLQFASDMGVDFLQELADQFYVEYVKDVGLTYPLGQTMNLTETEQFHRSYDDNLRDPGGTVFNTSDAALDNQYHLGFNFYRKFYRFRGSGDALNTSIVFSSVDWDAVFARWQEMNAEAPEYGHEAYFPVVTLNEITVNGIDYSGYAVYSTVDVETSSDYCYLFECYFVPKQEDEIAICVSNYLTKDQIKAFEESLQNEYIDIAKGFLQQITLR